MITSDMIPRIEKPDPLEVARYEARVAIAHLYELLPREEAHWFATAWIIAAERETRERRA